MCRKGAGIEENAALCLQRVVTRVVVWFKYLQDRIGTTRAAALMVSRLRVVSPLRAGWCHQYQRPRSRAVARRRGWFCRNRRVTSRPRSMSSRPQRRVGAMASLGVCLALTVTYRSQFNWPGRDLQGCVKARSPRWRHLLDLHRLMAYKKTPSSTHTLH
jgi:hypothetical protein